MPTLGGTHPSSPGLSTTPRVFGTVSGVSTSSSVAAHSSAIAALGGEESVIAIYALPGCAGPEVATGSVAELSNSGIQVTVPLGSNTTFSATNADLTGTSTCSNNISYQQVSDPPGVPEVTAVNPPSPADDNLPHVIGSADAGSTVAIYADPGCSGAPVGLGSAATFAEGGIQVGVADNSVTTFYARASWAELPSACSATSVIYQEVTVPPVTPPGGGGSGGSGGTGGGPPVSSKPPAAPKLRTVPGGRSNDLTPLVTGSAPGAALVRIYKNSPCAGTPVAAGTAAQLVAGFAVPVAENATTRFYGEAVSADGKTSDCSDPVSYTEDSSPPQTRITFGPGVKTRKHVAVFRFDDIAEDPPGTTFLCKFDHGPWKACQTPLKLPRLRLKAHKLRVKGVDQAGNEEATGAAWKFKVVRGT
ncbi:MAG TPA: hypothetical protein VGO13_10395 [Solirubrobacterales bacterium]|nr:hypothetical protein [Solirubrobacterales bacterium]